MRLREGFQAADVVAFDREEVSRNGIIFAAEPARQYARRLMALWSIQLAFVS